MRRSRLFITVSLAALATCLAGCVQRRPSVLIVSIDSLRADQLEARPGGHLVTPRLAALASESLRYDQAIAPAPWTTPSLMSLMTGLPAPVHGVEEHDRALASGVPTLAERFRAAGYHTAAFVPAATLRPEYGFDRGFESYDLTNYGHIQISSPELLGKVLARIESWRDEPFFIWVHLWDPHYNYLPPPPYDRTFVAGERPPNDDVQCLKWVENPMTPPQAAWLKGQYQGESLFADTQIGELLDRLPRLVPRERLILAVLADHGESFQEHGWLGHTNRVDETLVHVPLLLHWPGSLAPGRIESLVDTTSLGRTLLQLAGADHAAPFGLLPALPISAPSNPAPGDAAPQAVVLSQTRRQGCYTALRTARHKLVIEHRSCRRELFDLQTDPGETHDLASSDPVELARLEQLLRSELERGTALRVPKGSLPPDVVEGIEAALRTLGYVGGTGADGQPEVHCVQAPDGARRDLLGDAAAAPCPAEGVARCLGVAP